MNKNIIEEMNKGYETAFMDYNVQSNLAYRPEFLSNDFKNGKKVLSSLEQELSRCDQFFFSVAFITQGGIEPLLQVLKDLERKGVKGRILTTDYQLFTQPRALETLHKLSNVEIRMYQVKPEERDGFHTKGYIFKKEEIYRIIVGSSNMTLSALTVNREWNTKVVSTKQGAYAKELLAELNNLWDHEQTQSYEEFIDQYKTQYKMAKEAKKTLKKTAIPSIAQYKLKPNSMQVAFIKNLQKLRNAKAKRGLLISATGTGKTYASAFALQDINPKKALFLVHREQIAKQAIKSYKNVFGDTKKMELLSGNSKNMENLRDADFIFSTMNMMAKQEIMEQFGESCFDTIVIDEVHRAGAESYQRIIDYFTPDFWLGMTASPDRTDGYDIYELFDHNIAYEIRLQKALEENLLCPFHYFGITDLEIDGETFGDSKEELSKANELKRFNLLTSNQRVDYVVEQARYYGYSGNRVKGLVFCSTKNEAKVLSDQFNKRGYQTAFVCGEDSQERREQLIDQLVIDGVDNAQPLDYLFTVDIFNEGIDIPEVNQVIMLRPTQSPIIFIQQLGRGLRKAEDKEYVVILDFIGNYNNNFLIPIALSGD